jgi:hypothetical protein
MKRFVLCILSALVLTAPAHATEAPDPAVLEAVTLDYIEAYYEGSQARMERAVPPDLTKFIVRKNAETGTEHLELMTAAQLVELGRRSEEAGGFGKGKPQQKDVTILWSNPQMAAVALEADTWIDLMLLAPIDGQWKIVQVLWATKPAPSRDH